ncbi:MAG: hypothetical protein WBG38_09775 [Nodosilinea sp.]
MIKPFLTYFRSNLWGHALAIYASNRLWQEVWLQAVRSRWAEVAAAIAFLWLLGLLGLSFVLLHLEQQALWLPAGVRALAHGLKASLAIADANADTSFSRWGLGLLGLGAWLCLVSGSQRLIRLVGVAYGSGTSRSASWRTRLLPWGLTLLGLGIVGLVLSLTGVETQPGLAEKIQRLGRWAIALASMTLGLAVVYRSSPRRWPSGLPLWPGVRLVLVLGLAELGLRYWGLAWLARQNLAYGLLLALGLNLVALYGLILLVPMGAQVNLSTLRHRGARPGGSPPITTPPPSFESFKINRRD